MLHRNLLRYRCVHLLEHSKAFKHLVVLFLLRIIVGIEAAAGLSILRPVKRVNDFLICAQTK